MITSWSYDAAGADQARLKVFRDTGTPNHEYVVGESALQTMTPGSVNTFQTGIPVQGGDRIGSRTENNGAACLHTTPSQPGDTILGCYPCDPTPGQTFAAWSEGTGKRVNVAAKVEPDADKDSFGDETQDACPAKASTQGACIISGPSISGNTEVGKTLSASSTAQGGTANYQWLRGKGTTFTPVPGATGSSYKLRIADRGRRIKVTESVSNPKGSDSATSNPTEVVGPPIVHLGVKTKQRVIKQHGVFVKVKSDLAGSVTATGTIAVPNTAKTLRFKKLVRKLAASKTRTLKLTLSKKSFNTLKRALAIKRKLKARLTLVIKDKNGGRTTRKITVTLRR